MRELDDIFELEEIELVDSDKVDSGIEILDKLSESSISDLKKFMARPKLQK